MKIDRLDHLVLTVQNIAVTCDFYSRVLGMKVVTFGNDRKALQFGRQKINLHERGEEFDPKAIHPTPGSGDLCFITEIPLPQVMDHIGSCGVKIIRGGEGKVEGGGTRWRSALNACPSPASGPSGGPY